MWIEVCALGSLVAYSIVSLSSIAGSGILILSHQVSDSSMRKAYAGSRHGLNCAQSSVTEIGLCDLDRNVCTRIQQKMDAFDYCTNVCVFACV